MEPTQCDKQFKAREVWLRQFIECHRLSSVGLHGKTLSADSLAVKPFRQYFSELMEEKGSTKVQVFNAEKTGL